MTSRRDEKDRRRAERLAAEQVAAEQAKRRRTYSIVVGGVLALAAVAAIVAVAATGGGGGHGGSPAITGQETYANAASAPPQAETDLFRAAAQAGCVLRNPVIQGRAHVDPDKVVEYKTNPPTSGNHDPQPAGDGVYSRAPTTKTMKNFVHTLEHGRIEVQYDPALPKRRIDQLGGLFNDDPYHMLLFPNRQMPFKIAVTAWGHLLGCKEATDKAFDAIRAFRDRYRDQGPEQAA